MGVLLVFPGLLQLEASRGLARAEVWGQAVSVLAAWLSISFNGALLPFLIINHALWFLPALLLIANTALLLAHAASRTPSSTRT